MRKFLLTLILIGMLGLANEALAGFGVSPTDVSNDYLIPGAHFEKTIYLVRGKPDEKLNAEITLDAPEIESWISIDKGLNFPLPKGIQKVPMNVIIDVPKDADYKTYKGFINIRAVSSGDAAGGVSTVLGVRIDLNLVVTEKGHADFKVKGVNIPPFEKGSPMVVQMVLENTGNVKVAPSKVHVDVFDISHKSKLLSGDLSDITQVEPFTTGQIEGKMATDLEPGEYWGDITIYKEGESLGITKIHFIVVPEGTLKGKEMFGAGRQGFFGGIWEYLLIIVLIIVSILLIYLDRIVKIFKKNEIKPKKKSSTKPNKKKKKKEIEVVEEE